MATIIGTPENDNLIGFDEADLILGLAGNDLLQGRGGNDVLAGDSGDDILNGGDGFDTVSYRFAPERRPASTIVNGVTVNLDTGKASGGDGNDTLSNLEIIIGSSFNDILTGDAGDNQLLGLGGNDSFNGGAGFDSVIYSEAAKAVNVNLATRSASGGEGNDTLFNVEALSGSRFNDTLTGDAGDNALVGGAGSDTLNGGAGNDTLAGDDFNEAAISGAPGNDSLRGGEGNDFLSGEAGNDTLFGDNGNDTFLGRAGDDIINGGAGFDGAGYDLAVAAVNVNLTTGRASGGDGNDRLVSIEVISGSRFNDTLIGSAGVNNLFGLGGNDTLDGRAGNDTLFGSEGNDTLNGGTEFDTADYSALGQAITLLPQGIVSKDILGTDLLVRIEKIIGATGQANTIDSSSATGGTFLTVNLAANSLIVNNIPVIGSLSFTVENFVNVTGTSNNDTITGNSNDNFLFGEAGNDTLNGGDGNDLLAGFEGDDAIGGGTGDDFLDGGDGNDILNGGDGSDTLTGGANADTFDFTFVNLQPPIGIDAITDFNFSLDRDRVQVSSFGGIPTLDRFMFDKTTGALLFDKTQFASVQLGSDFVLTRDLSIAIV